ncbi:HIRAN domain-containing protein [Planococcus lenghuensis]|uniref:HIRAN domain-containing protein n=1 Tax=Planococcus lenghuensis TaxID=2213202 RepID=A0A1Q2KVM7_9BACL|nr:HIRAN domain-containing protein [Planococcus lenghuensis]AQQ52250.1 hypothetical protein B0X71_03400 [Planococcus lenghuensis]
MITIIVLILIAVVIFGGNGSNSSSNHSNSSSQSDNSNRSNTASQSNNTVSSATQKQAIEKKVHFITKTCPRCSERNSVAAIVDTTTCEKCGWNLLRDYQNRFVKLAGVTYEGRQSIIANMNPNHEIKLKRDKNNKYDKNAIGIYNKSNQNIGWIPKDIAAQLAQQMDLGTEYKAKINKISGGNGYNYGVEILISNDESVLRNHKPQISYSQSTQQYASSSKAAITSTGKQLEVPEIVYLDFVLTKSANQEAVKEVLDVLTAFIKSRDKTLRVLNRKRIDDLDVLDLSSLFDNTIMLAGGTESNFVHRHYKAILIQLSLQLGFLVARLFPDSPYARYAKSKMDWLSTMDVRLETKILQAFFDQHVTVLESAPIITDTTVSNQIHFWDIYDVSLG